MSRHIPSGFARPVFEIQSTFRAILQAMSRPCRFPCRPMVLGTFHCACPLAQAPDRASFAVVMGRDDLPPLEAFSLGSDEYPEKSTTFLLATDIDDVSEQAVRVNGPGVDGEARLPLSWVPREFMAEWRADNRIFPRGVDLILAGAAHVVGLPGTLVMEGGPCT